MNTTGTDSTVLEVRGLAKRYGGFLAPILTHLVYNAALLMAG